MAQVLTQITELPSRAPAHAHGEGPLVDGFGRTLRALRVSVTDACQFRCLYCMPSEDMTFLPHGELLTPDEIERLVGLMVGMGVTNVRLTGGEPLVRRELPDILARLAAMAPDGLTDLSLTTNGFLLERQLPALAAAGLQRLNVSIDSLVAETFREITRRDALAQVLAGLRAAEAYPQLRPIKVNAVGLRDITDREIRAFADLARQRGYVIRFIEFMPLDGGGRWTKDEVLSGAELKATLEASVPSAWLPLVPVPMADPAQTSRVYRFADGIGEIGLRPAAAHGRGHAADVPVQHRRDGPAWTDARRRLGRRACRGHPGSGVEQGVKAPHRRPRLPAPAAEHVEDRGMTAGTRRR
jgi:cyclic pyranopterin phosphate synthase